MDTGPVSHTAELLKRAKKMGVGKISHLLLTHLHPDHASGYFRVVEEFPKIELIENCQFNSVEEVKGLDSLTRWIAVATQQHPKRECARQGHKFQWEGLEINVLWPRAPKGGDLNHNSMVFTIRLQEEVILVMGDADFAVEAELLKENLIPKDVSIFVAGHHGADDASSEALLKFIKPKCSIIPVDKNNFYGRPAKTTLDIIRRHSKEVRLTGEGDIRLQFAGVKENQNRK